MNHLDPVGPHLLGCSPGAPDLGLMPENLHFFKNLNLFVLIGG